MVKYSAFSVDIETALKEGFYINTYRPTRSLLIFPNSKDTIRFDSAWSEHSWVREKRFGLCLCEHKIKGSTYNFCIPFLTNASDINTYQFDLKQLQANSEPYYDPGSYLGARFNFGLSSLRDTIKVMVTKKHDDPNTGFPFVDTVLFIKTNNSR